MSARAAGIGFNPLTWYMSTAGRLADPPRIRDIYTELRAAGFDAVHIEVPDDVTVADYRTLLEDTGLRPAPGYLPCQLSDAGSLAKTTERARRVAGEHRELGMTEIFIADTVEAAPRLVEPGVGADFDAGRLDTIIENLAYVTAAMVCEGVMPCLHQHVATWIETEAETDIVMDALPPYLLQLGPDTAHFAWVGADPVEVIRRYRDRIGAVHLKDFRAALVRDARATGAGYRETTWQHAFTEPGRGDIDFTAVLGALTNFTGWYVVEVDIADQPSPKQTAAVSAAWAAKHLTVADPAAPDTCAADA